MQTVTLGRTGITVNKNGFGALPIQRVSAEYAGMLLRKAYNAGITYFDTARSYSDSEEKMGLALSDVRENIIIATKTPSTTVEASGRIWRPACACSRLTTSTCTSSITRPSAPSPATAPACTRPWRRPSARGRSGLSASPTTGWAWRRRPPPLACMTPCSSPSATWPRTGTSPW